MNRSRICHHSFTITVYWNLLTLLHHPICKSSGENTLWTVDHPFYWWLGIWQTETSWRVRIKAVVPEIFVQNPFKEICALCSGAYFIKDSQFTFSFWRLAVSISLVVSMQTREGIGRRHDLHSFPRKRPMTLKLQIRRMQVQIASLLWNRSLNTLRNACYLHCSTTRLPCTFTRAYSLCIGVTSYLPDASTPSSGPNLEGS
jgi:hypothetical protein